MENVPARQHNGRLLSQLAGVADCAELGRCWQLASLCSLEFAFGLKAWQALFFIHDSSTFVSTCLLFAAKWNSLARQRFLKLIRSNFFLLLLLYCILHCLVCLGEISELEVVGFCAGE